MCPGCPGSPGLKLQGCVGVHASPQQIADGGLEPQAGDALVESRQIAFFVTGKAPKCAGFQVHGSTGMCIVMEGTTTGGPAFPFGRPSFDSRDG